MNQYLVGQGYWSYINGALENKHDIPNTNYPTWEQGASRAMYCLAICVHSHMLSHIQDAKMSKEAWENLKKIVTANMTTRKLQLRQELNNIKQKDRFVLDTPPRSRALRLAWLHQHKRQRRRDGLSMLGQPHTTIRPVKDVNLGKGKPSFILRTSINDLG